MKKLFVVEGLDTSDKKQEAEEILKQLGYTSNEGWNENVRDKAHYTFISIQKSGRYEYHYHPCKPKPLITLTHPRPLITLTELKSKAMNNVVIKAVKKEDGEKIIEYFKSKGVDTGHFEGTCAEESGNTCIYYGVIDSEFSNYPLRRVEERNAEIIELAFDDKVTWTREQFIELHSIACDTWKRRLTDTFKGFATQDKLEVTKEVYENMRGACTVSQRKVLDKIFGEEPFKKDVYFKCTKTLDDRFVKGKKYRLIKIINNDYLLENEFNREHRVSVGSWADHFYKVD